MRPDLRGARRVIRFPGRCRCCDRDEEQTAHRRRMCNCACATERWAARAARGHGGHPGQGRVRAQWARRPRAGLVHCQCHCALQGQGVLASGLEHSSCGPMAPFSGQTSVPAPTHAVPHPCSPARAHGRSRRAGYGFRPTHTYTQCYAEPRYRLGVTLCTYPQPHLIDPSTQHQPRA